MTTAAPSVHPLHHADTGTWSYVVADPATREAALIDPVLDFDAKSARTSTASAQALLDMRARTRLSTCAGCWKRTRTPTTSPPRSGCRHSCPKRRAGDRRRHPRRAAALRGRCSSPAMRSPTDGSQFDHLFADDEPFRVGGLACARDPGARPHPRQPRLPDRRRAVHRRLAVHARRRHRALRLPGRRRGARCTARSAACSTPCPTDTRVFVCHDYGPSGREVACETTHRRTEAQQHPRPRRRRRSRIRRHCAPRATRPWRCRR